MEIESGGAGVEEVIAGLKAKERWGAEEGRALLEVFEASGLKPTEFCRRHEIKTYRLGWWLRGKARRKKKEPLGRVPVTFAPVRLIGNGVEAGSGSGAAGASGESMEVVLRNGRWVAVGPRFEAVALGRLVKTLESLSC